MAFFSTRLFPSKLSVTVEGALWMVTAAALFSVLNLLIRHASTELHPFQVTFFRNFFSLAFMLPWLMRAGLGGLRTRKWGLYSTRALTGLAAMLTWFYAISVMPLAEAVALNFTTPLFATVGAALFLGEVVRLRRWTATVVGFLGVLVIVRPDADAIDLMAVLVLVSACFSAASQAAMNSSCEWATRTAARSPYWRSTSRTDTPMRWMRPLSSSRVGGVFRYSMTCGSSPLLRMRARVLRDVPQAGLW